MNQTAIICVRIVDGPAWEFDDSSSCDSVLKSHRARLEHISKDRCSSVASPLPTTELFACGSVSDAISLAVDIQRSYSYFPLQLADKQLRVKISVDRQVSSDLSWLPPLSQINLLASLASAEQVLVSASLAFDVENLDLPNVKVNRRTDIPLKQVLGGHVFELQYDDRKPQPLDPSLMRALSLPKPAVTLYGRTDLASCIRRVLYHRIPLALAGPAGVGKSTLAADVLLRAFCSGELSGGAVWIDLAYFSTHGTVVRKILDVLEGPRFREFDLESSFEMLTKTVYRLGTVLVFDNFDLVQEDSDLRSWISSFQRPARVVVLSRSEVALPEFKHLAVLPHDTNSRELIFREAATAINRVQLTTKSTQVSRQVLTASEVRLCVAALANGDDDPHACLNSDDDGDDALAKHVFSRLIARLPDAEISLLIFAAILPTPHAFALSTVLGESQWDSSAKELMRLGLIDVADDVGSGPIYRPPRHVRELTCSLYKHEMPAHIRTIVQHLSRAFSQSFRKCDLWTSPPMECSARLTCLDHNWNNLVWCVEIASRAQDVPALSQCEGVVAAYAPLHGRWGSCIALLRKCQLIYGAQHDRKREAQAMAEMGTIYRYLGEYTQASRALHNAIEINRSLDDVEGLALCLSALVPIFTDSGRFFGSGGPSKRALELAHATGDDLTIAAALNGIGLHCSQAFWRWRKARVHFDRAAAIFRKHGNHVEENHIRYNRALLEMEASDATFSRTARRELARQLFQQTLAHARDTGDFRLASICQTKLARDANGDKSLIVRLKQFREFAVMIPMTRTSRRFFNKSLAKDIRQEMAVVKTLQTIDGRTKVHISRQIHKHLKKLNIHKNGWIRFLTPAGCAVGCPIKIFQLLGGIVITAMWKGVSYHWLAWPGVWLLQFIASFVLLVGTLGPASILDKSGVHIHKLSTLARLFILGVPLAGYGVLLYWLHASTLERTPSLLEFVMMSALVSAFCMYAYLAMLATVVTPLAAWWAVTLRTRFRDSLVVSTLLSMIRSLQEEPESWTGEEAKDLCVSKLEEAAQHCEGYGKRLGRKRKAQTADWISAYFGRTANQIRNLTLYPLRGRGADREQLVTGLIEVLIQCSSGDFLGFTSVDETARVSNLNGPSRQLPSRILEVTKSHVFLSYCRDNFDEVLQLRDDLLAANEKVWWDQDILGGQDWSQEIRSAMQRAYAVVVCFSKETDARRRSGIFPELLDAVEALREYAPGSIFLIPVRLTECSIPEVKLSGTQKLNSLQYIDLFPPSIREESLRRLVKSLQNAVDHP